MNDTQHRRPDRSSNKKLCGSATFPAAPHAKMAQSGEHFFTINGTEIALSIVECDSSVAIQCTIANDTERKRAIKRQLLVASGILILCTIFNLSPAHPLTIACIGWLLYLLHGAAYLIEYEKVDVLDSLCVQCTTKYWLRRTHMYIPIKHIHDIVINEVIYGVSVDAYFAQPYRTAYGLTTVMWEFRAIYMLQVLMQGPKSHRHPVVRLFPQLNPSIKCLKIVYNVLQKRLNLANT